MYLKCGQCLISCFLFSWEQPHLLRQSLQLRKQHPLPLVSNAALLWFDSLLLYQSRDLVGRTPCLHGVHNLMELVVNFRDNSFGFHINQGMENALGIDMGEIPARMRVLGKGKPLGQTHHNSINSNLHWIIPC